MDRHHPLPHWGAFARRAHRATLATVLLFALLGCSREEKPPSAATPVQPAEPEAEHPEDSATGRFTVTGATPPSGNGVVTVVRRYRLAMPGQPTLLTIEGEAGAIKHALLVFVDPGGAVTGMTHRWQSGDESKAVVTECKPCAPAQVTVDAKTGEITLSGILLPDGIDMATGQSGMRSTLTGHVLP